MKEVQLIANDYPSRMKEILDEAWKVFKWQFANKAFVKEIENEAPFQLHFASIIRSIGNMYVLHGETFYVDLETKWEGKTDESCEKKKYIDITCGFYKFGEAIPQYACAIELKFKRKDYGALPHNLFASEGRLYFITNNSDYCYKSAYVNKAKEQGATGDNRYQPFGLNEDIVKKEVVYHPEKGSDEDRRVDLHREYGISWEKHTNAGGEDWYFLEIKIPQKSE